MGGTFTASIGGTNLLVGGSPNIPYSISASSLQQALIQLTPNLAKVQVYKTGSFSTGANWII